MSILRRIYDRLPQRNRSAFRRLLPAPFLRWYAHRQTDVFLISYPKCGRTWLRLMIGKTIAIHSGLADNEEMLLLNWKYRPAPGVPMIRVVHDDRPMLKTAQALEASKKRYRGKSVIFLARDPRDVIVSSYFEMKKRGRMFGMNPYEQKQAVFEGSLDEFIDQAEGGFDTILRYYNIWAANRHEPERFLLVRYEDMRADTHKTLRSVIDFLGLTHISDATIAEAVKFASFENMRKMEAEGRFTSGILRPAERGDEDSYKTRKGKVGGYAEHLSAEQIARLNHKMRQELTDYFGYS